MWNHNNRHFTKPEHFASTKPLLLGAFVILGLVFTMISGDILRDGVRISHYGKAYTAKINVNAHNGIRDLAFLAADEIVRISKTYDGLRSIELLVFLETEGLTDMYGQPLVGPLRMGTIYTEDAKGARQFEEGADYYNSRKAWFRRQITKLNYLKYLGQ